MYNILYVHGLGGSKNGNTGKSLKELCTNNFLNKVNVITEDFLLNPIDWITKINTILVDKKIDCLISSSLGAFMSLYTIVNYNHLNTKVILINPALNPDKDLKENFGYGTKEYRGKREDNETTYTLDDKLYNELNQMKIHLFNNHKPLDNIIGVFSRDDEFFHHMNDYLNNININCFMVDDATHHFSKDNIKKYIIPIIEKEINK